ncbi:MAG TPA: hypothetical protein VHN11_19425 [Xanthobacteraceae bacterium]|nr:hypothetical protein [Xanthobacteraceae bacterium]
MSMAAIAAERDGFWIDRSGKRAPDTESRRSKDGFGGWLLITSDQDWAEKWRTPQSATPEFKEATKLKRGDTAFVLIFFGNPRRGENNVADVSCDIRFTRPNQTTSISQQDIECFRGPIGMDPMSVFLSAPVIKFVGEAGDPLGRWTVEVTLHDKLRKVDIPLRASFDLAP